MQRVVSRYACVLLALVVALPVLAESRYEKHTSKYRLSQCRDRVKAIRDRMRPGMQAIFSRSPRMPVYVTKKLMLNAYADGSAITFSPVLCEALPGDEQLAIIVGHEIAHNLLGHYKKGLAGRKDQEREADYYGLYLAAYAGYDISSAPELFRALDHATGGGSGNITACTCGFT